MQPNEESNYQTSLDQMQSVFGIKLALLEKKNTEKMQCFKSPIQNRLNQCPLNLVGKEWGLTCLKGFLIEHSPFPRKKSCRTQECHMTSVVTQLALPKC